MESARPLPWSRGNSGPAYFVSSVPPLQRRPESRSVLCWQSVSVLVDGDDHNDPIADATRGILDGHIVLDRAIASQGRLPAVDPLASLSRLAPKIRTKQQAQFVTQLIEFISRFEDTRDLRAIGGYRSGSDPTLDRAMEVVPRLYDAMKQDLEEAPVDDVFAFLSQKLPGAPRQTSPSSR